MKLLIESLNHTADGIGKINGKIIFVKKAIPNDYVEIENIIDKKNYMSATIKKIIKKSNNRIDPICPYFNKCGGCQLMNMNYKNQLEYKKNKVINIMEKYANEKVNPEIIPSKELNYRNKITLQVKDGNLGLYEYKTNNLIEIKECLLVTKKTNNIIKIIKENINIDKLSQIIIKDISNKIMITFIGTISKKEVLKTLKDKVESIYINDECISGQPFLIENLNNYKFHISSKSFFQINHDQTIKLYNKIIDYLDKKEENILDLYCGTGSIGIYISKYVKKINGIEINKSAIKDALNNKKINKITNINFECNNANKIINNNKYTTIIVDPPRGGLDKKTINILLNMESKKIIYVSCNPITLARDISILKEKYKLKDITLVDLFPNTYHVESICFLTLDDELKKVLKIVNTLDKKEKDYICNDKFTNSPYLIYRKVIDNSFIEVYNYNSKLKDEHPISGNNILVVTSKNSRGKGNADKLIKLALKECSGNIFVYETDKNNKASIHLAEKNNFVFQYENNNVLYYTYKK